MTYVEISPSMLYKGFAIGFKTDKLPFIMKHGSYNVLSARLMNLSYDQYLRYCRDYYGAKLIGKNSYYVVPVFPNEQSAILVGQEIDKRAKEVFKS